MSRSASAASILARYLKRKQSKHPAFSLRAFARRLGVSPSYISALLKGTKALSSARVDEICDLLDMDDVARNQLRRALLASSLRAPRAQELLKEMNGDDAPPAAASTQYEESPTAQEWLLERWYFLPILDLSTCTDFEFDPEWVASRLSISVEHARQALGRLVGAGLLVQKNGKWVKFADKIRFPASRSRPSVRLFHAEMLKIAIRTMESRLDEADYAHRLIAGGTMAVNPANFDRARDILHEALFKVTEVLTEGECTEVYQLGAQLFPLTKR